MQAGNRTIASFVFHLQHSGNMKCNTHGKTTSTGNKIQYKHQNVIQCAKCTPNAILELKVKTRINYCSNNNNYDCSKDTMYCNAYYCVFNLERPDVSEDIQYTGDLVQLDSTSRCRHTFYCYFKGSTLSRKCVPLTHTGVYLTNVQLPC